MSFSLASSFFGGLKLTSNQSSLCYSLPPIRQTVSVTPSLKTRLRHGEKLKGMLLFSVLPTMVEIASLVGYDFIVVDLEHEHVDYLAALGCIRATEVFGCKTIIRVPEIFATCAKGALDLSPNEIMFPKVEMRKVEAEAVSLCLYAPHSVWGCAYSLVRDSEFGFNKSYLEDYGDNMLIMCQVHN